MLCQMNINGLSNRSTTYVDQYILSGDADLVFISESKTANEPLFDGFQVLHHLCKTNLNQRGGVSFLIKNTYSWDRQLHLENAEVDAIFAIVTISNLSFLFVQYIYLRVMNQN